MELAFHGLADSTFGSVGGKPTSLAQVGYNDAGLDDVWQKCGKYGPKNYTYHTSRGTPVVDTLKFPDMKKMTDVAHALGLTAGWYGNNCRCGDHCDTVDCFAGDVNATLAYGFDSIKLDGCGKEEDVALWNKMFNQTITRGSNNHSGMMIENCHNGGPAGNTPHYDAGGELQCPFHTYRSSMDIRPQYGSILVNLMSIPPLAKANLSVPGCWAYPDMLEVGVTNMSPLPHDCGSNGNQTCKPLSVTEARTHFGAWCIVSAPLVIGMNFSDVATVKKHWEVITNMDAVAVNQDYAGFSGSIFYESAEKEQFKPCSWGARADCGFSVAMSWHKPLSGSDARKSTMAVLLMNNGVQAKDLSFKLSDVPGLKAQSCTAWSVWESRSLGEVGAAGFTAKAIGSRDSVFLTLHNCQ
jgi:alpha-galactosidase